MTSTARVKMAGIFTENSFNIAKGTQLLNQTTFGKAVEGRDSLAEKLKGLYRK